MFGWIREWRSRRRERRRLNEIRYRQYRMIDLAMSVVDANQATMTAIGVLPWVERTFQNAIREQSDPPLDYLPEKFMGYPIVAVDSIDCDAPIFPIVSSEA